MTMSRADRRARAALGLDRKPMVAPPVAKRRWLWAYCRKCSAPAGSPCRSRTSGVHYKTYTHKGRGMRPRSEP